MNSLRSPLVLACAAWCSFALCAPIASDQERIQGVWLAQTESQSGRQKPVTYRYIFRADRVKFIDENGTETTYSFKLDPTRIPKLCIIRAMGANSKPVSVAYELKGDSLKIVVANPGSVPKDISDKNNQELIICKRKSR
jgi:uncharacterized protein (TIGR03067 family)